MHLRKQTNYVEVIIRAADLYGDKQDVAKDSCQGGVTENIAGIYNTGNEDHWAAECKASKKHRLKQPVAVIGQDIYHLHVWKTEEKAVLLFT